MMRSRISWISPQRRFGWWTSDMNPRVRIVQPFDFLHISPDLSASSRAVYLVVLVMLLSVRPYSKIRGILSFWGFRFQSAAWFKSLVIQMFQITLLSFLICLLIWSIVDRYTATYWDRLSEMCMSTYPPYISTGVKILSELSFQTRKLHHFRVKQHNLSFCLALSCLPVFALSVLFLQVYWRTTIKPFAEGCHLVIVYYLYH